MKKNNKLRILLVDDDEINRIYFRDIFWIHGGDELYEIYSARSIKEARSLLENNDTRPNVIFLDVLISEKGERNDINHQIKRSYEFVSDLKKDKSFSDLKVVIYSSQNDAKTKKEFFKLGTDGFLIKGDLLPKEIIAFTNNIYECNNKNKKS